MSADMVLCFLLIKSNNVRVFVLIVVISLTIVILTVQMLILEMLSKFNQIAIEFVRLGKEKYSQKTYLGKRWNSLQVMCVYLGGGFIRFTRNVIGTMNVIFNLTVSFLVSFGDISFNWGIAEA